MMQSSDGKEIQFIRGLPEFKEDLREIDPKFNNVLVPLMILTPKKQIALSSPFCLRKAVIEMLV